ncbi:MAG: DUF819 family protein [Saprospirales bacterium]|nr:DUF819 family protein [Saprospirales bacterium]
MSLDAKLAKDAFELGIILVVLAGIFVTAQSKHTFWKTLYKYVPAILLAALIPALLHWPVGLITPENSRLYFWTSRFLLPAALVLLCLGIDFKGVFSLGPKALILFLAGTLGIVIGGPIAVLAVVYLMPGLIPLSPDELWRGLSTIAGSWIGGAANMTAMKEIFKVDSTLWGTIMIIDVIVSFTWMSILLYLANFTGRIDRWMKADGSSIQSLVERVTAMQGKTVRIPAIAATLTLLAVAFGCVGLAHWGAQSILELLKGKKLGTLNWLGDPYFLIIVLATTLGLALSFTKLRKLESSGASRFSTIFIYLMVAMIGMNMNLQKIFDNLGFLVVGIIWMLVHVLVLLLVARWVRAPFFFVAVGSQANVGGAASAPIVAAAFHPALAPVGVLLSVLGYALGTYAALLCAWLMEMAATSG